MRENVSLVCLKVGIPTFSLFTVLKQVDRRLEFQPTLFCPVIQSKNNFVSPLHVFQSIMPECQCVHIVIQDPSLVIRTRHECLGLLLRGDIEGLIVDALEAAFDHCIFLLFCLKYTLVQIDVLHTHSFTVNYDIARNSLCCVVYYMLFINQAVHFRSESHELGDAMSVVFVLEDGSRQLLVEI